MGLWPRGIGAITLFVEHLEAGKQFYREVFGLPGIFEDDDSAVFRFGDTLVNLLKTTAAAELIEPAVVARREAGSRLVFTIEVDDVDATCAELAARGVELLNGPMDRPWGPANGQLQGSRRPHLGDREIVDDRTLPSRDGRWDGAHGPLPADISFDFCPGCTDPALTRPIHLPCDPAGKTFDSAGRGHRRVPNRGSTLAAIAAAVSVFPTSHTSVTGPTPPGTGVIASAFAATPSKSRSPTMWISPVE